MSKTVKTYGRQKGGIAFYRSRSPLQHLFSSSPSSSDTSPGFRSAKRRKNNVQMADIENLHAKAAPRRGSKKPALGSSSTTSKVRDACDTVFDLQTSAHRRPLADISGTMNASSWVSKRAGKVRCKNRRKTVKLSTRSILVKDTMPDFSDIENHSLLICDSSDHSMASHIRLPSLPSTPFGKRASQLLMSNVIVSTPHENSTGIPNALGADANMSAIEEDSACDASYHIMTRARLRQTLQSMRETLPDKSNDAALSSMLSFGLHVGSTELGSAYSSPQSMPSSTSCPRRVATLPPTIARRCTRRGASTLSFNGTEGERLESIVEDIHSNNNSFVVCKSSHSLSLIRRESGCLRSSERRSLAEVFPDDIMSCPSTDEPGSSIVESSAGSPRTKVLRECEQDCYAPFSEVLPKCSAGTCKKVGEGVYGEVFLIKDADGNERIIKVVPVEGDFKVNGEPQKSFDEILPEIVISQEVTNLSRDASVDSCSNFIQLASVLCAQGSYPVELLQAWDKYHREKSSENDSPKMFGPNQLFVLFEYENGGTDLERYQFSSILQGVSILRQVVYALAVAECALQFEHRDLHWGNVLVQTLHDPDTFASYVIGGHVFSIPTEGVSAKIIDFTLSRLEKDGRTIFMDLSNDETLFTGKGDYQFDIYRKMKEHNGNDWESLSTYSNVLWIHYLADKLANAKSYPKVASAAKYRSEIGALRKFITRCLSYVSALDIVLSDDFFKPFDESL